MRRELSTLAVAIVLTAAAAAAQTPATEPQPTSIDGATTHVYKTVDGTELRLHVFAPTSTAPEPRPAIVFFFGGGWTQGTVMQFVPQSKHLAERGMVAIVADYRVFARHGTDALAAMADAKSAVRWVRAHAAELGVDPERIAAAGGSAGGHLAAATGVLDGFDEPGEDRSVSSRPNAMVLFNPAVNTAHDSPLLAQRFDGHAAEASPLQHLHAGLPPTVIFHGRADATVPYADVESFCRESAKLGNGCELHGYEGAGHGFFNRREEGRDWYRETLHEMDRFLTELGWLESPVAASG